MSLDVISLLAGIIAGIFLGGGVAWLIAQRTREDAIKARMSQQSQAQAIEVATTKASLAAVGDQLRAATARADAAIKESADARADFERRLAESNTRLEQANKNVAEQHELLKEAEKKLTETFKVLGNDVLVAQSKQFLELAQAKFAELQKQAEGDLGKKQEAIDLLLKPVSETLVKYEEQLKQLEVKREKAYASLDQNLKGLSEAQASLQKETTTLSTALRNPKVRGRWGEITLERVAELSGMVEHCDFTQQASVEGEEGRQRPDMIVRLPGQREVAVDSKVPLEAYLDAIAEEATPDARKAALERHSEAFRTHLKTLSSKAYWKALAPTPEFVVLFVPGEPFLSAALEHDRTLIEDGLKDKVLIATPTTLVATLLAVAHGWRQHDTAENAEEIRKLGVDLYDRLKTFGKLFGTVGTRLDSAVDAYNKAVASYDGRLAVTTRRFQEVGVAAAEDLPEVAPVEKAARRVELQPEEVVTER